MIISGFLFAQNEAYNALKVLEPYIGKWQIKESSYGFFEGLPEDTETINKKSETYKRSILTAAGSYDNKNHMVTAFRTSDDYRISISGNLS